jgi:hypothetical protein
MRLFVATAAIDEAGEFAWTIPGELVHMPTVVCDDEKCGCERSMAGFVSHRATTCFVVRELDIDAVTYTALLFDTLERGGWVKPGLVDRVWVEQWAVEHMRMAGELPLETPLRFQRDHVMVRQHR